MKTDNLDKLLSQLSGEECNAAAEELERYLDAGLAATRELLAAFLNDLRGECLIRWDREVKAVKPLVFPSRLSTRRSRNSGGFSGGAGWPGR